MNLLRSLRERQELRKDYEATFGTPHGKRVLAHLFKEAGITVPSLGIDRDAMLLDKGMQRIVWSIYRMTKSDLDLDAEIERLSKHKEDTQ